LSQFDDIETYLTVPNAPSNQNDAGIQFFWCGLENLTSDGDWISVIQPELVWGDNQQEWVIQNQYVPNPTYLSGNLIQSPQVAVSPGDQIFCQVWQIGSNEWKINAVDETSGNGSTLYLYPAGLGYGNYPYNWAQLQIYEVQNLVACSGMPAQEEAYGYASKLQQAGPSWNSEYNVLSRVTVGTYAAPSCSYYNEWYSDGYQSLFSWNE
jgi:hypothetical protein